jgi:hypothetical protein
MDFLMIEGFTPHLNPREMLELGVFGGSYFEKATDEDLLGLGSATRLAHLNRDPYDVRKNQYEAKAGEDFAAWTRNGWIFPEDPLGWFHWYCRYSAGRRHERDEHQMKRWINYKRWARVARTQQFKNGFVSAVVKQGLIQWAYSPMQILHGE